MVALPNSWVCHVKTTAQARGGSSLLQHLRQVDLDLHLGPKLRHQSLQTSRLMQGEAGWPL